jgi:cytoskeletal protein RodZ
MNSMSPEDNKRAGRRNFWLAALLVAAGLTMIGLSLAQLQAQSRVQVAQGTGTPGQPLQATPSPQSSGDQPAESKPGGTRPTTPAPEPARPDSQAQKEGAKPALPPAPPEKMSAPIKEK